MKNYWNPCKNLKFLIYALYVAKLRLIIYRFKIDDEDLQKKWVIQEYIMRSKKVICEVLCEKFKARISRLYDLIKW